MSEGLRPCGTISAYRRHRYHNETVIEWVPNGRGVLVGNVIYDPHADKPGSPVRQQRQLEAYAARRAVPECTDETLLAAGTRDT